MEKINSQIPIGRFSILTRIIQKNLRLYDEQGILKPENKDIATGYRYYSSSQLSLAIKINLLKNLGFSIAEIKEIILDLSKEESNQELLHEIIQQKIDQLQIKIQNLEKITSILVQSKTIEELLMSVSKVEIKELDELRVVSKREKGTYSETVGKLIGNLFNQIHRRENNPALVKIVGPVMAIYHDHEYKEQEADIEVAVPIVGRIVIDEEYELKKLAGGKAVTILHTGPYYQIGIAWDQVMQYIEKNKLIIQGPPREVYLNDPNQVPEEQLLTEIQVPVAS